jgi:hypothetical protein
VSTSSERVRALRVVTLLVTANGKIARCSLTQLFTLSPSQSILEDVWVIGEMGLAREKEFMDEVHMAFADRHEGEDSL